MAASNERYEQSGKETAEDPTAARQTAVLDREARREDFRREIAASLSTCLGLREAAILCGIGAVGALPATTIDERIGDALRTVFGGAVPPTIQNTSPAEIRRLLLSAATSGNVDIGSLGALLGADGHAASALSSQVLTSAVSGPAGLPVSGVQSIVVPDGEDIGGAVLTRVLSDRYLAAIGLADDTQAYHEAKALAYSVTAVLGTYFGNPSPIAFFLAGSHAWKAFERSRSLSAKMVALSRYAIEDGAAALADYSETVADSSFVDGLVHKVVTSASRDGVGPVDLVDEDEASGVSFGRNRWSR